MEMLKIADICRTCRCGRQTVERLVRAGKLPQPIQLVPGGTRLWPKNEIDRIFAR